MFDFIAELVNLTLISPEYAFAAWKTIKDEDKADPKKAARKYASDNRLTMFR